MGDRGQQGRQQGSGAAAPGGEHVVDVPAKLTARVRMLDTGHGRKTDAHDAHSDAVAAVRTKELRVLALDPPVNGPHRQNRQTRVCQPGPAIGTHSLSLLESFPARAAFLPAARSACAYTFLPAEVGKKGTTPVASAPSSPSPARPDG